MENLANLKRSQLLEFDKSQLRNLSKLAVVGDLHGDYNSLHSILNLFNPKKDGIIFLGDYADRGNYGIEVLNAVQSLVKEQCHCPRPRVRPPTVGQRGATLGGQGPGIDFRL